MKSKPIFEIPYALLSPILHCTKPVDLCYWLPKSRQKTRFTCVCQEQACSVQVSTLVDRRCVKVGCANLNLRYRQSILDRTIPVLHYLITMTFSRHRRKRADTLPIPFSNHVYNTARLLLTFFYSTFIGRLTRKLRLQHSSDTFKTTLSTLVPLPDNLELLHNTLESIANHHHEVLYPHRSHCGFHHLRLWCLDPSPVCQGLQD